MTTRLVILAFVALPLAACMGRAPASGPTKVKADSLDQALERARELCGGEVKVVSRQRTQETQLKCVTPGESSPTCLGGEAEAIEIRCVDNTAG